MTSLIFSKGFYQSFTHTRNMRLDVANFRTVVSTPKFSRLMSKLFELIAVVGCLVGEIVTFRKQFNIQCTHLTSSSPHVESLPTTSIFSMATCFSLASLMRAVVYKMTCFSVLSPLRRTYLLVLRCFTSPHALSPGPMPVILDMVLQPTCPTSG